MLTPFYLKYSFDNEIHFPLGSDVASQVIINIYFIIKTYLL